MTQQERRPLATAMTAQIHAIDWATTPIGPCVRWSLSLRTGIDAMLASPLPQCLALGPQMTILYNDAFADLLGAAELRLGMPFNEVWQEAWATIGPLAHRAYHGRSTLVEDLRVDLLRAGVRSEAYYTLCNSPLRDEHGLVRGFIATVIDGTQRVQQQQRLHSDLARARSECERHEARVQRIWELSTDLLASIDAHGNVAAANPALCALLGRGEDELLGQPWLPCLAAEDRAWVQAQVLRCAAGGPPLALQARVRAADGRLMSADWTVVREPGQQLQVCGRLSEVQADCAEAAPHPRQLASQQWQHELNNRLHVVVANLSLLERSATEPQLRYIHNAQQAVRATVALATQEMRAPSGAAGAARTRALARAL